MPPNYQLLLKMVPFQSSQKRKLPPKNNVEGKELCSETKVTINQPPFFPLSEAILQSLWHLLHILKMHICKNDIILIVWYLSSLQYSPRNFYLNKNAVYASFLSIVRGRCYSHLKWSSENEFS